MRDKIKKLTVQHIAIVGLLILSVVAVGVLSASILKIIEPLSGWNYVGILTIILISLTIVYISPNYIETNIPGFGPVGMDSTSPDNNTNTRIGESSVDRLSLPNGFEDYIKLTRFHSSDLANQLYQVYDSEIENPFEATSNYISKGIQSQDQNPIETTLQILESDLEAREFILNSENHDMEVVSIDNDQIITKMDSGHYPPEPGLEFKLYARTAVNVDNTTETFPEWVGTVRVERIDDPLCVMKAISWKDRVSDDPSERSVDLMQRGAWVEIGLEEVEDIDWDSMEEVHEKLKQLKQEGELNYAN